MTDLSQTLAKSPTAVLVWLVDFSTRTDFRPGGELARIRAAALMQLSSTRRVANVTVAKVLRTQVPPVNATLAGPFRPLLRGRRFIVAHSGHNPYFEMIHSRLNQVGFAVHYVAGFSGILDALSVAQSHGERPHVHLNSWLTPEKAGQLVDTMKEHTTFSLSAHDLEQNVSRPKFKTGMEILLHRAAAIHLLTSSSLQRLGIEPQTLEGRFFIHHIRPIMVSSRVRMGFLAIVLRHDVLLADRLANTQ
jgi:hypothetical protein